ncbi:MAG: hypothetical protein U0992_05440 [Planctomycetaceae bacterium]
MPTVVNGNGFDHVHRVLVVDDHPMVREGIAAVINREPDLKVCAQAEGLADAMRFIESNAPTSSSPTFHSRTATGLISSKN